MSEDNDEDYEHEPAVEENAIAEALARYEDRESIERAIINGEFDDMVIMRAMEIFNRADELGWDPDW